MNKRIYFILFPLLAILFCVTRQDSSLFISRADTHTQIAKDGERDHIPLSTDVNKNTRDRIKNAIRIKAKHNAVAIHIAVPSDPVFACLPFHEVIYGGYRVNVLHAHFSSSGLRGPPTV